VNTNISDNIILITRLADILSANRDNIIVANTNDTLISFQANANELDRAIANLRNYHLTKDKVENQNIISGYAVMVPYNAASYALFGMSLAAALMAFGNTKPIIIHFPSMLKEYSEIIKNIIGTDDLFSNIVFRNDSANEFISSMLDNPDISLVQIYGGAWISKYISKAIETKTSLIYEGLGNNAAILLNDADLSKSIDKIFEMAFTLNGQAAVCFNRLVIDNRLNKQLIKELMLSKLNNINVSINPFSKALVTPIIKDIIVEKAVENIKLAEDRGANILGLKVEKLPKGTLLYPTIIFDVKSDDLIWLNDSFAPTLSVMFADFNNIVDLCNISDCRMTASIFGSDKNEIRILKQKLKDKWEFILTNKTFIDKIKPNKGYIGKWGGKGKSYFYLAEETGWQLSNIVHQPIEYFIKQKNSDNV